MTTVLGRRALNRALLARQLLLERAELPAELVMERLVGMQAQEPGDPYVALWTRLIDFRPDELVRLLESRAAVRATTMLRTTIHLVTAADAVWMRPILQPVAERTFIHTPFAKAMDGVDLGEVIAHGRELLADSPMTIAKLGKRLAERWPDREPGPLGYVVRFHVPLVQVPPRGLWGRKGQPVLALTEEWVGRPMASVASIDELVLRYLAAFGPATPADIQTWSWLTAIRPVLERLRPRLRTFRDETGRELFDVTDGPLPDPETPAPVRFLPLYDNVFLSHADRSRIVDPRHRGGPFWKGFVLVDGFLHGIWKTTLAGADAHLTVHLVEPIGRRDRDELGREGERFVRFLHADADTARVTIG
ncbi:MAG TPA: winged helix DNA-binding domain-containing protein [Candidatus Limnocylindria bacterium]|nr:winged helix DNA-binding domain-containing protein [Candidatus Limnocylindria bacterium]